MTDAGFEAVMAHYGPPEFVTAVALFHAARIVLLRRRLGRSPVTSGDAGTKSYRLSPTFRVFRALIWLAALARAIWPPVDAGLVPLTWLHAPEVMAACNFLMVLHSCGSVG